MRNDESVSIGRCVGAAVLVAGVFFFMLAFIGYLIEG
jgi:hypothetical protein